MITRKDIQAACDDIVREFAPMQVILFGSYAYGTPTEDSDVYVLVRSPEEIADRVSYNDWFLWDAMQVCP